MDVSVCGYHLYVYVLFTDSDVESSDQSDDGTETEPLVEFDGAAYTPRDHSNNSTTAASSKLKLILFKSIFFIGGFVVLVAGGIASQYHPPVDFNNCTQTEAVNQSIVVAVSDTV